MRIDPSQIEGGGDVLERVARLTPQWLAGFFDGDGYVGIIRTRNASSSSKWYLRLKVNFTNKDALTLCLIASKFGVPNPLLKETDKYKSKVYELSLTGPRVVDFLEVIKDHVVIRRKQVELALEFASTMLVGSGNRYTDAQLEKGLHIRNEISALNGAGRKLIEMDVSDVK
jgi:LAGLIDADG endonuclease